MKAYELNLTLVGVASPIWHFVIITAHDQLKNIHRKSLMVGESHLRGLQESILWR